MNEIDKLNQQTEADTQECASAWKAICSKKAGKLSAKLTPIVASAMMLAHDAGSTIENFGGYSHWQ